MPDNRFKNYPLDARFPGGGDDTRFPGGGVDARFSDLVDTRFEGDAYGDLVSVELTGLSTDATYGDYALVGDHAGISAVMSDASAITAYAWEIVGGAALGAGASPTDFAAGDTGSPGAPGELRVTVTTADGTYSATAPIRAALAVNTLAPVVERDDPSGSDWGDIVTVEGDTWTAPAAVTYNRRIFVNGSLVAQGVNPSITLGAAHDQAVITGNVTATTSLGSVTVEATGFTVDDFTAPTVDPITISGTPQSGQTLSLTGGAVNANPTPAISIVWKADGVQFATGSTATLTASEVGAIITAEKTATNDLGSDTAISAGVGPVTAAPSAANITITSIGPQASDGTVPVAYTIDQDDPDVKAVLFLATDPNPTAADFGTGATTGYIDIGTVALTTSGSGILLTGPDGLLGNYKLALLPTGGGDADVRVSASFALDSTDAVLSPLGFTTGAGAGEVDWSFTPDEAGTYRTSIYPSASTPTDADLRAGTGATATVTGAGIAATSESGTLTGTASTAYNGYVVYTDEFSNETISGPVAVTAGASGGGGSLTKIDLGDSGEITATSTIQMDFSLVQVGDLIVIGNSKCRGTSAGGVASISVEGSPTSVRTNSDDGTARTKATIFEIVADASMAGNAACDITVTLSASGNGTSLLTAYAIRGTVGTVNTVTPVRGTSAPASVRADLTVATDGIIILVASNADAAAGMTMTPTSPLATDLFATDSSAEGHLTASGVAASTGTLSVGYDQTNGDSQHYGMVAAFYGA